MSMGINIGMPGVLGAGDAAIQASLVSPEVPPADVTITIEANDPRAAGRLNSDGNYYTITFPDDYLSGEDLFLSARSEAGAKIGTGVDAAANLDIIFNVPVGMRIGANTANNIVPKTSAGYVITDPALHFKFNTSHWASDILTRLNVTVNNYGVVIGGGGSGGWGGMKFIAGEKGNPDLRPAQGGAGSGQGLHPSHGTITLGDYYDPNDTTLPAGQAGSGYRWWSADDISGNPSASSPNKSANGIHGTAEDGDGVVVAPAGARQADSGDTIMIVASYAAGIGHYGGSVIYYDSDVATSTTGTHITLYNAGWMRAGCGGGSGSFHDATVMPSGYGGSWARAIYGRADHRGAGSIGYNQAGSPIAGGFPGQLFEKAPGTNLSISNTVTNVSANTIYGWNEEF
jgi:hypothetical protein